MEAVNDILAKFLNPLVILVFAVASLIFMWGVIEFMAQAENKEARTTGKKHMIWGIIGMAIMVGAWGIVRILMSLFDFGGQGFYE